MEFLLDVHQQLWNNLLLNNMVIINTNIIILPCVAPSSKYTFVEYFDFFNKDQQN